MSSKLKGTNHLVVPVICALARLPPDERTVMHSLICNHGKLKRKLHLEIATLLHWSASANGHFESNMMLCAITVEVQLNMTSLEVISFYLSSQGGQ